MRYYFTRIVFHISEERLPIPMLIIYSSTLSYTAPQVVHLSAVTGPTVPLQVFNTERSHRPIVTLLHRAPTAIARAFVSSVNSKARHLSGCHRHGK